MNCFCLEIIVFGLTFIKRVYGSRENYTDKQISEIKDNYRTEIREQLLAMGYIK